MPNEEGGYAPNDTPACAVEGEHGLIVKAEVVATVAEPDVLVGLVTSIDTDFDCEVEIVGADAAHSTGSNIAALEEQGKKFHRIERAYGRFVRSFVLPDNVDPTKVTASMKDGVLEVRLVKAEQAKPKQIEISVN